MIRIAAPIRLAILVLLALAPAGMASALPTMIRIGYTGCASCHYSPQGGGPLNPYGKGIDQAQSLRGGEYQAAVDEHRRLAHDLRVVLQDTTTWVDNQRKPNGFRPRLMYRNVTQLSKSFRVSGTATLEGDSALRPVRSYDPPTHDATLFVNTALVHYRPRETLEFAAGRDQLPSGINVPDLGAYIKSRNRLGYYDAPTQLKMYWWGKRHQVTPFIYGPGGNEATGEHEKGAGTLAEFDVLGNQRTVIGTTYLNGTAHNGDRRMLGGYARLGFGKWGILAEHDVTDRTRTVPLRTSFRQNASYAQIFWAAWDWLVFAGTGERLRVEQPFAQRLNAARIDVSARLASQATIVLSTRFERNLMTGQLSKAVMVQTAFKTVQ
jgi:hypothetical protein